jgi:hypothetical protein
MDLDMVVAVAVVQVMAAVQVHLARVARVVVAMVLLVVLVYPEQRIQVVAAVAHHRHPILAVLVVPGLYLFDMTHQLTGPLPRIRRQSQHNCLITMVRQ